MDSRIYSPVRAPRSGAGWGAGWWGGGGAPANFAHLLGRRGPLGLPVVLGGPNGPKIVRFGSLRPTRPRQDEPIEVGEAGSKRPSLGCNRVHVTWWGPLIARSSQ
jgi:hypothetical protein